MVNKRKKNVRARGKTTHFYGSKKKNRGAGNRGGRGMAGSGKKADQKKPSILKKFGNSYFGKFGFNRPQKILIKNVVVNIGWIDSKFEELCKKEKNFYTVDLKELGYTKLLGSGKVNRKYKVKVDKCSNNAKEKIEKAGGEIQCLFSEQS